MVMKKQLQVKLKRLCVSARLPIKGTSGSAYYDLYAAEDAFIIGGRVKLVTTGWNIEVPEGYFLDIRPRSGLAAKGITINNSPGTVDADYRGELKIIVINLSGKAYKIAKGDRIAQCALMPVLESDFIEVAKLSSSDRGTGGYGSTGR
jgi:dUTP pyrophosphatase